MKKIKLMCSLTSTLMIVIISCKHDTVAPQTELYFPRVKSIIQTNCVECHSPGGQGMPVLLNTDENIVQNAAIIKAATVDPARPGNIRMPEGGELSQPDKDIITAWYDKGGKATD